MGAWQYGPFHHAHNSRPRGRPGLVLLLVTLTLPTFRPDSREAKTETKTDIPSCLSVLPRAHVGLLLPAVMDWHSEPEGLTVQCVATANYPLSFSPQSTSQFLKQAE